MQCSGLLIKPKNQIKIKKKGLIIIEIFEKKLYPTNDFIFKRIYGRKGSEEITESLIKAFTGLDVKLDEMQEQKTLEKDLMSEKTGILDVYTTTENGEQITIEMQISTSDYLATRLLKYNSEAMLMTSKGGEDYDIIKRTISIMFLKNDMTKFKKFDKPVMKWNLREEKYHDLLLTDKSEFYIIRLGKIKKDIEEGKLDENSKMAIWTKFLLAPETLKEVEMKENEEVKKADELYKSTLESREERLQAIRREMFLSDIVSEKKAGREEGREEGRQDEKIYNIPINVDTIEKGYPILCA